MDVLAFSPHPDDTEIGMGGTIAKHVQNGDNVTVILVTTFTEERYGEASEAAQILDAELETMGVDPHDIEYSREFVGKVDAILAEHEPDIVYTSWRADSHQDHTNVTETVISATRKNKSSVYMYEQMLPGGITHEAFNAQLFVDISEQIDTKIRAVKSHETQYESFGDRWIEAIRGRAACRGYQVNASYAEAFSVIKEVGNSPTSLE